MINKANLKLNSGNKLKNNKYMKYIFYLRIVISTTSSTMHGLRTIGK